MSKAASPDRLTWLLVGLAVFAAGAFLRLPPSLFVPQAPLHSVAVLHPQPGFNGVGFDENLYRRYVDTLHHHGLASYPDLAEDYVEVQTHLSTAILPPTRFVYIFCAYCWRQWSGADSLAALKDVSSAFSIATLLLGGWFTFRLRDERTAVGTMALLACAPAQIHMSQHALIDGVFGFFALLCLWLLWENLQAPGDWRWLTAYGLALAALVLTKENALFAYIGMLAALAGAWWFGFGKVTPLLLAVTLIGPLLGVAILVNLCGSLATTVNVYRLLVSKAAVLPYAIHTGDGPWYRYLVDLLLVSPLIFLLTFGALFHLRREEHSQVYLVLFLGASFLVMCNVRYGMNLRYANMWDFPMRYLVVCYLTACWARFARGNFWLGVSIALLCAIDLRQYNILFVRFGLYELVPEGLLRALHILK